MHNYTYIKTPNGPYRLKYPVHQKFGDKIFEVRPKDELGWKEKHLSLIENYYRSAKYFNEVFDDYRRLLLAEYSDIVSLNTALIRFFVNRLGFSSRFINSSELKINSAKTEKIITICKTLGAGIYYSGTGAKAYQDENQFRESGIMVRYSDFSPTRYPQLWGQYQQNVTSLDFFMNCGYDWDYVLRNQHVQ
jgi:hypothetical protein